MPTTLADAAHDLLPVVGDLANRAAVEREIPIDALAVVEKVYERLPEPIAVEAVGVDPYLLDALTYGAMRCYRALNLPTSGARREFRIGLEQIRQALSYIIEEAPVQDDRPPGELARWLAATLNSPLREVAEVLDVNVRTLQRWVAAESVPTGSEAFRLAAVARLVNQLRHAFTSEGVLMWLREPHRDLKGQAPLTLLDAEALPALMSLASRARSNVFA